MTLRDLEKNDRKDDINKENVSGSGSKKEKRLAAVKLLVILAILAAIPLYMYIAHPDLVREYMNAEAIKGLLEDYKGYSILLFLGLNVLQVIFSLPGQVFQLAGGYAFGFWLALLLSVAGVATGSSIVYFISRKLGHDAIRTLFGGSKVTNLLDQLNSRKGIVILFVGYLIPGMPKDLLNYVSGLSDIRYKPFILLSMTARLPGMIASLFIGDALTDGNYTRAIIVAVCVIIAAGICLIKRGKITEAFGDFYDKYVKENR
ncbi:MAG: TVP38/TMEM64 family protein [Firmicutes bacterium]|nr:TVP38/TMEM64 family protein [Bacillota bacterium]